MLIYHRLCRFAIVLCVWSLAAIQSSTAQSYSSWDCLPEETVVALRIPDGQAVADAIRETKFGAVMFNDRRKAAVAKVLESGGSGEWSEFQDQLKEYGLTTDELLGLLVGESGYAVVMTAEDEPVFAGLGWLQPGEELAGKIYEVIAKIIDEQDDEQPITRLDLTLADQPVMQLRIPSLDTIHEDKFDVGDEYADLPAEQKRKAWKEAYQKWQDSAVETVVYRTLFVTALGNRLLIAHGYQAEDKDSNAGTAEQLSAVFGQWIDDHANGSEGFASRLTAEAGAARVMALEGLPVLKLLGDVAPLVKLLRSSAPTEEKADQAVRILGLNDLGPFAMRSTVQGSEWRTQVSVAVPAPREGLLQLLDQEGLSVDPPQWVPASAVRYYQLSFDPGKAYEIIKEALLREFPDQVTSSLELAEASVQNFASASLTEVLSSLGNRHIFMSFGLESEEGEAEGDEAAESLEERMAIVWEVQDEELWARLLKAITPFAGMASGTEFTEEQGFSGWRMKSEKIEGGLFLGNGYLVLGYGSGVVETILSSINNPPNGSDAFRGSDVFGKANTMIDLEPGLAVEVTDGDRYLSMMHGWLESQLSRLETLLDRATDSDEEDSADNGDNQLFIALARAVMPSRDEIEGMMGVTVSRWEVNDDGVFGSSAQEMPAP